MSRFLKTRGAGGPPAKLPESGKQVEMPMLSVISRLSCPPWEVRNPAALWRMEGGRMAHAKSAKSAKFAGGEREERTRAVARRAWRGRILHERTKRKQKGRLECRRDVGIEKHENRFADIERREGCGWGETTWTMQKHPGFGQSGSSSEKREFSNDWKVFSNGWKKWAEFSTDWKNFSAVFQ